MRKFKVVTINPLKEGICGGEQYKGEILTTIPILSDHYSLLNHTFRCIEHKKGLMKLTNEDYLILLIEIW